MAIKELTRKTLGKTKAGWIWDKKRELFFTWQVDTIFRGERHIRRGFRSNQEAQDYLDELDVQERLKKIGYVAPIKFPTVEKLFEKYLSTIQNPRERKRSERVFKVFRALLPAKATLDEIERKHTKDYADLRISEGVKPETANREITCIAAAIHKAPDFFTGLEKWIPPKIYRPQVADDSRERVVTREERDKLISYLLREKEAGERDKDFLARYRTGLIVFFASLTGLRHGEICALKKINFNRQTRRLVAERFKTKKKGVSRTVFQPLTDTQLWVLDEAAEKLYPQGEYFFSERGKPHNKIYTILRDACAELDIPYGEDAPGGFILHDLRHTFVTILEHGMIDSTTTRSFSGHTKETMLKRYAHATPDSRARAMKVIEREVGGVLALNGNHKNADGVDKLKKIYDAVREGKMTFDDFRERLEFECSFFT